MVLKQINESNDYRNLHIDNYIFWNLIKFM